MNKSLLCIKCTWQKIWNIIVSSLKFWTPKMVVFAVSNQIIESSTWTAWNSIAFTVAGSGRQITIGWQQSSGQSTSFSVFNMSLLSSGSALCHMNHSSTVAPEWRIFYIGNEFFVGSDFETSCLLSVWFTGWGYPFLGPQRCHTSLHPRTKPVVWGDEMDETLGVEKLWAWHAKRYCPWHLIGDKELL